MIELTKAGQAVLAALHCTQSELKWIEASRLFRATQMVWRATGRGPVAALARPPDVTIGIGVSGTVPEADVVTTQAS